jgi:excisionase family DNA binding protein
MEIMSARELSRYLKINEKKIYQLAKESKLPHTWIGGKIAFVREIIDQWIARTTEQENHIYIAGSDDVLLRKIVDTFNSYSDEPGVAFYAPVGSINGLKLLEKRAATVSCVHIMDLEKQEYNTTYIDRFLTDQAYVVTHLYMREQGIYVEKENPKKVEGLQDIAQKGLKFINRNKGSGTRLLIDFLLVKNHIEPGDIKGYDTEIQSHLGVGLKILKGEAEAAVGIRHVAHMLEIGFVPLLKEKFDLVVPEEYYHSAPVKRFLSFFDQSRLVSVAGDVTGYDISRTGSVVSGNA